MGYRAANTSFVLLKKITSSICDALTTVFLPNQQHFDELDQQINPILEKCLRQIQAIKNRKRPLIQVNNKINKGFREQNIDLINLLNSVFSKAISNWQEQSEFLPIISKQTNQEKLQCFSSIYQFINSTGNQLLFVLTLPPSQQQSQKKEQKTNQIELDKKISSQSIFHSESLQRYIPEREHQQQYLHAQYKEDILHYNQDGKDVQLQSDNQNNEGIQQSLQNNINQQWFLQNTPLQIPLLSDSILMNMEENFPLLMDKSKSKSKVLQQPIKQIFKIQQKKQEEQNKQLPKLLDSNYCEYHPNNQRRYYCQQSHYDGYKHLCNTCVQDKASNNKHNKDHIIKCKAHNTPIKYKLKLEKEQMGQLLQADQENLLLCLACLDQYKNKYRQISIHSFVLNCHLQQAQSICIDQSCRKNDNFKVCHVQECTNYKQHESHQKIPCNKKSFSEYFHFQQHQVQSYQLQFSSSKSKMAPWFFQKILQEYLILIQQSQLFLQSFTLNNRQAELLIDKFFQEQRKGFLMILLGIKNLQNKQFKEQQKKRYLDKISDSLEQQLPLRIKQIILILKNYALDIQKMFKHSYDEIDWNEKYQKIILNQTTSNHQQLLLQMAGPQYRDIVKAIYLEDNFCDYNSKRKKLYQQFYNKKFKEGIKDFQKDDKEKIKKIFFRINYENQYKNNDSTHKQLILNLIKQKQKIQQKLSSEELYLPLTDILKSFQNLRVLNINYSKDYYGHFHYQIEASHIFKIIYQNKDIQKIVLKGVRITGLSLFIKHLRLIQEHHISSYQKLLKSSKGDVEAYLLCYQQDGQKQQINLAKRKLDLLWMNKFVYSHKLYLSIEADLNFSFYCQSQAQQQIKNLQYLLRWNITFSNVDLRINLSRNDSTSQIQKLVQIMRKMPKIKASLMKYKLTQSQKSDPFYFLIQQLSNFTNIVSLQMKNIIIADQSLKNSKLSTCFNNLCQNNQINHFKSTVCTLPIIPPFKDLTSIEIKSCRLNKSVEDLFNSNKGLKMIKFSENIILEQLQKQKKKNASQVLSQKTKDNLGIQLDKSTFLQTLIIQNKFIDLSKTNLQNLKYLKIVVNDKPEQFNLSEILRKLQQIREISIIYERKPQQNLKQNNVKEIKSPLLSISSKYLERIHIENWDKVNNEDIIAALKRWDLKQLRLRSCLEITEQLFKSTQILKLQQLKVDLQLYQSNQKTIRYLKRKGVNISFYQ